MNFWALVLLVLLAVVAVAVHASSRRGFVVSARRLRKRHLVVRIVCGLLGATILTAIAVGTRSEVRRCYAERDRGQGITLHVPTLPTPVPELPRDVGSTDIAKARLLFQLLVADVAAGTFLPVHGEEREIQLREGQTVRYETAFDAAGYKVQCSGQITGLRAWHYGREEPPRIQAEGQLFFRYRGPEVRGSMSTGSLTVGPPLHHGLGSRLVPLKQPLSVASGPMESLSVFTLLTWVAEDDPLRAVTLGEFVASREAALREAWEPEGRARLALRLPEQPPLKGVALAAHIGLSALLLMVVAGVLTQLFARRWLAFVGVLTAVVLYVAVLDRLALGAHLGRLANAEVPVAERVIAARQCTDTFFYRETARSGLEAVAKEETAPRQLRDAAKAALQRVARPL